MSDCVTCLGSVASRALFLPVTSSGGLVRAYPRSYFSLSSRSFCALMLCPSALCLCPEIMIRPLLSEPWAKNDALVDLQRAAVGRRCRVGTGVAATTVGLGRDSCGVHNRRNADSSKHPSGECSIDCSPGLLYTGSRSWR